MLFRRREDDNLKVMWKIFILTILIFMRSDENVLFSLKVLIDHWARVSYRSDETRKRLNLQFIEIGY